jgi:protein required for attachment to host cells
MKVPHGAHVMVVEGGRYALFVNRGKDFEPSLELLDQEVAEWPKTSEIGGDRPGRAFESAGARRSAYEAVDIHEKAEDAFVTDVARRLEERLRDGGAGVILIAAPRALGVMRQALGSEARARLLAEVPKAYGSKTAAELSDLLAKL